MQLVYFFILAFCKCCSMAPNFAYFSIAKAKRMRIFSIFFLRSEAKAKYLFLVRSKAEVIIFQKLNCEFALRIWTPVYTFPGQPNLYLYSVLKKTRTAGMRSLRAGGDFIEQISGNFCYLIVAQFDYLKLIQ